MSVTPRVLLSIDYEPVYALFRWYDKLKDADYRRGIDSGFTRQAIDPLLEQLGNSQASFYLVGEIVDWYPEVPQKIVSAGHELGLHCHIHRPLGNVRELAEDLRASTSWCKQYRVRGYRAPMIGIHETAYQLLGQAGFLYSSSIYAPTGVILQKGDLWEIPVSTLRLHEKDKQYTAPRDFSLRLIFDGEIPYGSSFSIGVMGNRVLKIIEQELKRGLSPVIILHPYELVKPASSTRLTRDLARNPLFLPFLRDKSHFLSDLLRNFPVSSLGSYLAEHLKIMESE